MDPTVAELSAMRTIAVVSALVGVDAALEDALFRKIGLKAPRLIRHVVAIKWSTWNTATANLEVMDNDWLRALTPVEEGQVGGFRSVCRQLMGLPGDEAPHQPAPAAMVDPACHPREGFSPSLDVRKIKLGNILDQPDDSAIAPLPANDVPALVASWARLVNDTELPSAEQEATGDPLTALRARLNAGLVPYADFSVWRPHGARMLMQLKFQAHHPAPDGGWRTREIAGPPSYEEWRCSWSVFAFAMEVLQAASRARLERCAAHIWKLSGTYTEFWPTPDVGVSIESQWWITLLVDCWISIQNAMGCGLQGSHETPCILVRQRRQASFAVRDQDRVSSEVIRRRLWTCLSCLCGTGYV